MATKATKARELMNNVNKALGEEAIRMGSDKSFVVKYINTGILPIDALLAGGIPLGRFTVLTGDWSTLKTYIGLCAIREVQAAGGIAALIDTERTFDPQWAKSIGINVDDLLLYPSRDVEDLTTISGEMAIDAAEAMVRNGVDLLVFDSVAAALPEAERKKRMHDENIQPGRLAALMSAACRRLTAANNKTAVIWINQLRENIGVSFGPTTKATGGRALPYFASYILNIKKVGKITRDVKYHNGEKWQSGKEQIGQKFQAELQKSKLNKPFRDVWFDYSMEDSAIDEVGYMIAQGIEHGWITQKGASYSYGPHKAVGRDKWRQTVLATPALYEALESAVRDHHGIPQASKTAQKHRKHVAAVVAAPAQQKKKPVLAKKTLR